MSQPDTPLPTSPRQWQAEEAPVGHFTVLRALPTADVQAIGPFVFLDHFGPFPASPETLPAHPHAGIEVMTYLLEGANEHRDSYGHQGVVESGGAQWMRAGRGILHAETHLPERHPTVHGLQIWARLPRAQQHAEPAYRAIAATDIPRWQYPSATGSAVELRLLAGSLQGQTGPLPLTAPSLLLHMRLLPGSELVLPLAATFEHGLYGISGNALAGTAESAIGLTRGGIVQWTADTLTVRNVTDQTAELLLLGGTPAERPLYFGGPFVLDSLAGLRQAQRDYFAGKMGTLDGVPHS